MADALVPLALRQHGLIRREQAVALGMAARRVDHLVRRGDWIRMYPSVYLTRPMPSVEPAAQRVRLRAAVLWAGPDAVLVGRTAAWWHQAVPPPEDGFELAVGRRRRLQPQAGIRLLIADIDPLDRERLSGLVVTTIERTALDLAAVGCTDMLDLLLRQGRYDSAVIATVLDRLRGRRGWATARAAVAESADRPFSAAERILHRLFRAAGVTGWRANVAIWIAGRRVVPDVLFAAERLVVEIDGREHHTSRAAFESDRERQNLLVSAGFTVLRFTWTQLVGEPDAVLRQICSALAHLRRREMRGGGPS